MEVYMHGSPGDDPQQEPGGAGQLEAQVASGDDGGERGRRESLERQLEGFVRRELGATQTSRAEKARKRRRVRKGGKRGGR